MVGLQRGGVVYNVEEKKRELGKKDREACYVKKVSVAHVVVQVCLFVCLFFFWATCFKSTVHVCNFSPFYSSQDFGTDKI